MYIEFEFKLSFSLYIVFLFLQILAIPLPLHHSNTMPPPINYFNNNQSLNYTMQPQSSSSTNNGQAQKRSNTILDDYYQKTNKARAIVPKTGNSPLFKPLIPKQQVSSAPAVALNKALENVSLKDTTAAVQESSVVGMKIITGSIDKLFKIQNLHSNIHALYEIFGMLNVLVL